MKKRKRRIILMILLLILFGIFLFQNKKREKELFQEELIFFKWFSSSKQKQGSKEETIPQYSLEIANQNKNFQTIHLLDTVCENTLIHEKIAPGTKGEFILLLKPQEKINYQITFQSKNQKPENLNFAIKGKDKKYNKLEEMEEELKGEITENKKITIQWEWEYEKNKRQDLQDTQDGETIKKYEFTIYAREK